MKTVLLNLFKLYLLISEGTLRYRYLGYQELNVVYLLAVHLTFIGIGLAVLSTNREIDSWTCAYTLAIIFFIHTSAKNGNCYSYCNAFYPHCTQKALSVIGIKEVVTRPLSAHQKMVVDEEENTFCHVSMVHTYISHIASQTDNSAHETLEQIHFLFL